MYLRCGQTFPRPRGSISIVLFDTEILTHEVVVFVKLIHIDTVLVVTFASCLFTYIFAKFETGFLVGYNFWF